MLTKAQFDVLVTLASAPEPSQRRLAQAAGVSLGSTNKAVHELLDGDS